MANKEFTENEIYAAIAMALHEFEGNNIHDAESNVLTIKPRHTLWNAKISSMRVLPNRK